MSKRQYTVQFRLWDASTGEASADLLEEEAPQVVNAMPKIAELWDAYRAKAPVELEELPVKTLRVYMSRNAGVATLRFRFTYEEAQYLITVHVSAAEAKHVGETADGLAVELYTNSYGKRLTVGGEEITLREARDE